MGETRFEDLMGRMLDEELTDDEWSEFLRLLREDPERRDDLAGQLETAELLALAAADLHQESLFLTAVRSRLGEDAFVGRIRSAVARQEAHGCNAVSGHLARGPAARRMCAVAAAAVLVVLAWSGLAIRPRVPSPVARVTELNGPVVWIGDGGRVVDDLIPGASLDGGTLDARTADAWATLEFRDGSVVTVSGPSMLTFSENRRKELHLREGDLFARVAPQTNGRPMLIQTRTARIEVLGTRLNVGARPTETRLTVNEGRVRLTRLVDGRVADVATREQLVATGDRGEELRPTPRQAPVSGWQSDLLVSMGQWLPPDDRVAARLRALPIILNRRTEGTVAVYVAGFGVAQPESPPVRLEDRARFRLRGRLRTSQVLHFGVTTRDTDGGFGGKFECEVPAPGELDADGTFEVEIPIECLRPRQAGLSGSPAGLEMKDCYVCTVDIDAGLEVFQVELHPPSGPRL